MTGDEMRDLAATTPGPTLAGLLDRLDPATLTPEQAVPVLQAWSRQRAHAHARLAATLTRVAALSEQATAAQAGHRPGLPAADRAGEWAGAEIAAALTWSDSKTVRELGFADTLSTLPQVAAAFDHGDIDYGKAWVFTDLLGPAALSRSRPPPCVRRSCRSPPT